MGRFAGRRPGQTGEIKPSAGEPSQPQLRASPNPPVAEAQPTRQGWLGTYWVGEEVTTRTVGEVLGICEGVFVGLLVGLRVVGVTVGARVGGSVKTVGLICIPAG